MKKIIFMLTIIPIFLYAGEPRPNDIIVNVLPIEEQTVNELQKFVGSAKFNKSSNVASESSGVVKQVNFSDGEYVQKNQILAILDTEIIDANIEALKASIAEATIQLEQSQNDLNRYENLIKSESIIQKTYDDQKFLVAKYTQKVLSLKADLKAKEIERGKKIIKAPFDGTITTKSIEIGEWASVGKVIANIVDTKDIDLEFNVPSNFLVNIKKFDSYDINIAGVDTKAKVSAIIPKGDIATRTFPLKLKLQDPNVLVYDGMQTSINLSSQKEKTALVVPRDAVIKRFDQDVIFVDTDSQAKMIPVKIVGYKKDYIAIEGDNLKLGQMVIVKGNERIFPNSLIKSIPLKR